MTRELGMLLTLDQGWVVEWGDRQDMRLDKETPPACLFRPRQRSAKPTRLKPNIAKILKYVVTTLTRLSLLKPVNELLHLFHEDSPALRDMAILVPLQDDLLTQHLSLIEQEHYLVEALQEVLVVIAVLLDLIA